jgi:hypothetical protein
VLSGLVFLCVARNRQLILTNNFSTTDIAPERAQHGTRWYQRRKWNGNDSRRTPTPRSLIGTPQGAYGPTKLKLDEETRWQIAGEAIEGLRRYGGWKELDEEAPMRDLAPGTGPHDKREGWKAKPDK